MKRFEPGVLDAFDRYTWPGNVRELRNVVEGMVMLTTGDAVTVTDLPAELVSPTSQVNPQLAVPSRSVTVTDLEAAERDAISAAIATCQGNLAMVARELRISKSTLYMKLEKHGLGAKVLEARAAQSIR